MKVCDVKSVGDLAVLFSTEEGCSSAIKELFGMFDREVYDVLVHSGRYSAVLAGALANKMGRCVVDASDVSSETIRSDSKAILLCDMLADGQEQLDLIQRIESLGCRVIRVGFVIEDTACGARKARILRKYPFEAMATI